MSGSPGQAILFTNIAQGTEMFLGGISTTRPEWQKKRKKMAGREGPKKGKVR